MMCARASRSGGVSSVVEFGILGPVQAVRDGREVGLGGPRRRALLALLLVAGGRVIPAERLAEELWGGCPPPAAAGTLRAHVSRLRTLLSPDVVLAARGGGYALSVEPGLLDAARFERLAGAGREALEHGEAAVAATRFREALGLWRGRALADVAEVESLAREAARLEELRLAAAEGRIEADLELGLEAQVAGELEALVAEYPVRERLWRLLVLALYRAGRQADALAAYRRARDMLAAELGIEPGAELQELERQVLRQEVPAASPRWARHNLPARLTSFVGREEDLARLDRLAGEARLVTLTGAGGAGKTRLAVEFAAAGDFRDGVWLADLAGTADPGLVPSVVMQALGVRQSAEVTAVEALVYRLWSAELLLVLDNCEHLLGACADLAAALLGSCPGLRVLATSREPLGVPGEAVYLVPPLAVPAESADMDATAHSAAVRLFVARAASASAGSGGLAAPVAVVARICRELDGLPLAIELAAARTSVLSAEEIEACLADRFRFLGWRRPVADPRHQTLKAAIGWSYELLSGQERRVFGGLSVFAGGFTLAAVAAVCCGGDQASALDLVDQLAAKSLLVAEPTAAGTRYRLLETVRQYAARCLADAGETEQARQRHAETFLRLAGEERELAVLAREQDNFRAALDFTLGCGSPIGPRLARALGGFWLPRGLFSEARGWLERSLAARLADRRLRADLLRLLGAVLFAAGDLERAQPILAQGAEAAAAAALPALHARIRILQADIHAEQSGIYTEALDACAAAAALLESEGDLEGLAEVWLLVGKLRFWVDDTSGCQEALERAISYAGQSGYQYAERESRGWLASNLRNLPIPAEILIRRVEQQLEAAAGDPWAEAMILHPLSVYYAYAARFADARVAYRRAQSIFTASGAKLEGALLTMESGRVELMAGDPAAAERELRQGHEALVAMGERGYRSSLVTYLAEAVCAVGKFDQALRLTEEAGALTGADDLGSQARWRAVRARVLARLGQFPAATRLADEAVAFLPAGRAKPSARRGQSPAATRLAEEEEAAPVPATSYLMAECLVATGEVALLAGALDEAEERLRRALQFYQDRRMVPLAAQAGALLARLTTQRRSRAGQRTGA
jgi:predicted ATPase/DNA-binding SARP family transcriptional activator